MGNEQEIISTIIEAFKNHKLDAKIIAEIKKELDDVNKDNSSKDKPLEYIYSDNYKGDRYTVAIKITKSENGELIIGDGSLKYDE
ncbi:hypothetical protein [Olivibacter domesticus]|uniref:Uncharacterized protein n=1 Tax=Olivibacter domesticus TaxID=407022 RepID=A0A1H7MK56_OLID1|nr:hypothetical protein [Olivibacter domesticus]SEL11491.1 hypothetical protein SAMN05661044_02038 [Olivibacter domesticus]